MKSLAVLFVLTGAAMAPVTAQTEHAPNVAQCRNDQKLWLAQIENEQLKAHLVWNDFVEREGELSKCMNVDEPLRIAYHATFGEYSAEEASRYLNFLTRHNLLRQFVDEDAAGQR